MIFDTKLILTRSELEFHKFCAGWNTVGEGDSSRKVSETEEKTGRVWINIGLVSILRSSWRVDHHILFNVGAEMNRLLLDQKL